MSDEAGGQQGSEAAGGFTQEQVDAAIKSAVEREVAGLRTKNSELLGKLQEAKPLLEMTNGLDADGLKEALDLARETRENKMRAEGEWEKLKTQMAEAHTRELQSKDDENRELKESLYDTLARQKATEVLIELEGVPKVMLPHITPYLKVIRNDNAATPADRYRTVVVDGQGNPRVMDGNGTPMTVRQLVEEFRDDNEFAANFGTGGNTGSGARTQQEGTGREHTISKAEALDTKKYRAAREAAQKAGVELRIVG